MKIWRAVNIIPTIIYYGYKQLTHSFKHQPKKKKKKVERKTICSAFVCIITLRMRKLMTLLKSKPEISLFVGDTVRHQRDQKLGMNPIIILL